MALTSKQQVFVSEYLGCWNASEAARRAGYNGKSNVVGPRLLNHPVIKVEVDSRLGVLAHATNDAIARGAILGLPTHSRRKEPDKVYFIQAENGLIKIGITNDVPIRLEALNTASPVDLRLLFFIPDEQARSLEAAFHNIFKSKWVKGEWFRLSEADLNFVRSNYDTES